MYLFLWLPDVYFYLKDPPPEFLPRFGTITMAGLLGMFLARKGNALNTHTKAALTHHPSSPNFHGGVPVLLTEDLEESGLSTTVQSIKLACI